MRPLAMYRKPRWLVWLGMMVMVAARSAPAVGAWGETYRLQNGLRVVLSPDARFPSVTVLLRYHVAARNEPAGRSGISHLVEHMTFRVPRPTPQVGSYSSQFTVSSRNGTTHFDETEYYTTMPSGDLKYAIWTERWRMGIDLSRMTESDRKQELDVVRNERRERLEIMPYRAARHRLWIELFPAGHPYHEEVIGSMQDLQAISLDDVRKYFRTYYGPSNATLAVVGDFNVVDARNIIQDYFGALPAGLPPPVPTAQPRPLTAQVALKHDEIYGRTPLLHLAWHAPPRYSADNAAGDVTAMLLGGLEANRLMMYVPEAESWSAYQESMVGGSVFHVVVGPKPGVSLEALQRKVDAVMAFMRTAPLPVVQVECAVRRLLRERLRAMEDTLSKARFYVDVISKAQPDGDPLAYVRERLAAVKPEDVLRFSTKYLTPDKRVVMHVQPAQSGQAVQPGGIRP
jgi:zinc protease